MLGNFKATYLGKCDYGRRYNLYQTHEMGTSGQKCVYFGHNIFTSAFIVLKIR